MDQRSRSSGQLKPVVVNLVGEPAHGLLAESRFVTRPFLPGGEHNMYEFAFAGAAAGFDVELRGWLHEPTFEEMRAETSVSPRVGLPARLPEPGELVVVPEGWRDPLEYARLLLSPARLAVFVLAPPGLFGWPFCGPGWQVPDPLVVPLDGVARPEHFQAMDALGIALLTHSPGIVKAAEAAGVACTFVGTGRPSPPEPPGVQERSVDAVGLLANRWAPLVREVASELGDANVTLLEEASNHTVLEHFANARILIWPSRIEGHATIPWEARISGCVPVGLSTNRFAVGLTPDAGAVVVDRVDQLAPAIRELLADQERWRELSERAMRTAPGEVRWPSYLERVTGFLNQTSSRLAQTNAYAGIGAALRDWIDARANAAQSALEGATVELDAVRADRDRLHEEAAHFRSQTEGLSNELNELYKDGGVRLALKARQLRSRQT